MTGEAKKDKDLELVVLLLVVVVLVVVVLVVVAVAAVVVISSSLKYTDAKSPPVRTFTTSTHGNQKLTEFRK